jgi:hypothetical protein
MVLAEATGAPSGRKYTHALPHFMHKNKLQMD